MNMNQKIKLDPSAMRKFQYVISNKDKNKFYGDILY